MKACFMGLGYIGLPTAVVAARGGVEVVGVDINPRVVGEIKAGRLPFVEPGLESMLREAVGSGALRVGDKPEESEVYVVVVPTPFKGERHDPDTGYVETAVRTLIPLFKSGDLCIIESTSPIGTTERMAEIVAAERPELKETLHMAYCPERVLPGNVVRELEENDRVVGGMTPEAAEHAKRFYAHFVKGALHVTHARTAEMVKLVENASRDGQIAFANELSMIAEKAGLDVWEVIDLANRHPRVNILRPGCGVGGHCIAVDPYFITSAYPEEARMIGMAREVNHYKTLWCIEKVKNSIGDFERRNGREPRVAMMGLAFKPDIDDLRESPAAEIVAAVKAAQTGAEIMMVEPNIRQYAHGELVDCETAWTRADIAVVLVGHTPFRALRRREGLEIIDFAGILPKEGKA